MRVKGSDKSILELHGELLKKEGLEFLASNARLEGTGTEPPKSTPTQGEVTALPPGFDKWDREAKVKFFRENQKVKP